MATKVYTNVGSSTGIAEGVNSSAIHLRSDMPHVAGALSNSVASIEVPKIRKEKGQNQKYKHVFAIHSKPRTSCLSHEAVEVPSFLGFRNLMVIVLSEFESTSPASCTTSMKLTFSISSYSCGEPEACNRELH